MRVAFDVSILSRRHSFGLRRVVESLLAALERRGVLEVVRLAPGARDEPRRWRQTRLPHLSAAAGCVGIHSFTSAFPLRGPGLRVQTVHELPWRHGVRENAGLRHRAWAALGGLRAQRIVCPSPFVARDLGRHRLARGKLRVVPWGVTAAFRGEPPPGLVDEGVLTRYRLAAEPFLFCPGAVRPKKNLAGLLYALAERKQRGAEALRVVITGGDSPQLRTDLGLASKLGLGRWIAQLDEVAEADLPSLYRLARAVPVLSHSEGFALPVLEAMACGTPVLVPRASAQAELAGEAGILVDARSPGSIADGLELARKELHARRALGLARARAFDWEASARGLEELWQELA